jgi:glycosyltransferase involved in cell wall biosynthesis
MLAENGHHVTWWTSNVDHTKKKKRFENSAESLLEPRLSVVLLDGILYHRNVSLARLVNHWQVARAFTRIAETKTPPDIIFAALPTIELAQTAALYGRTKGIPTIIDIRDLWPDVLVDVAPNSLRWLAEFAVSPLRRQARQACAAATAIVGLTKPYLEWGLEHAGRAAGPLDRIFPLGYTPDPPPEPALRAAEQFWRSHGIGAKPEDFVIAYFGMMGVHFEAEPVETVIRSLSARGSPVKFVLCGAGAHLPRFQRLSTEVENLLVPGWIDAAQIWTLMRSSKLGLAPYTDTQNYQKNVTNKIVEYLSAGLPLLTNMAGEVERLIRLHNCGYFYPYGSAEGLERVVLSALSDPQGLRECSENALTLFQSSYSADRVYVQLMNYLEELAWSKTRHAG